jgi:hypothetical protein
LLGVCFYNDVKRSNSVSQLTQMQAAFFRGTFNCCNERISNFRSLEQNARKSREQLTLEHFMGFQEVVTGESG